MAGIILVADGLVDLPLDPFGTGQRLDGNAVRFDGAIPAAFTDFLIDEEPLSTIRDFAALATPPQFSRAGLNENQRGEPADTRQVFLHRNDIPAVVKACPLRPAAGSALAFRIITDNGDTGCAFSIELAGDGIGTACPHGVLPAGHGNGTVVEQLERGVDPGGDRSPDPEVAGII